MPALKLLRFRGKADMAGLSRIRQHWCPRYSSQIWQGPGPGYLGWRHVATIEEEDQADFRLRNEAYIRGSIVEAGRLIDNASIGEIGHFPSHRLSKLTIYPKKFAPRRL